MDVLGELNPALRVPTLILDDGRALAESHAITWYFAEASLCPRIATSGEGAAVALFRQYDPRAHDRVVRLGRLSASPPPSAEIEAKRAAGYRALDALERGLTGEEFLVGGRYTLADIALYAYTTSRGRWVRPVWLPGDPELDRPRRRPARSRAHHRLRAAPWRGPTRRRGA